jgi:hypothetical protein
VIGAGHTERMRVDHAAAVSNPCLAAGEELAGIEGVWTGDELPAEMLGCCDIPGRSARPGAVADRDARRPADRRWSYVFARWRTGLEIRTHDAIQA